jgi:hypothetical protein
MLGIFVVIILALVTIIWGSIIISLFIPTKKGK